MHEQRLEHPPDKSVTICATLAMKRKRQQKRTAGLRNQVVLIVAFVALVLLLLFVRLINFVRGSHARFFR